MYGCFLKQLLTLRKLYYLTLSIIYYVHHSNRIFYNRFYLGIKLSLNANIPKFRNNIITVYTIYVYYFVGEMFCKGDDYSKREYLLACDFYEDQEAPVADLLQYYPDPEPSPKIFGFNK